ncbi:hypothetical protein [uncultured Winogradskyella sp.]|uniref:hypothetical protein n=1 Tax=uncultured Winogradskyella sp. TaxID=395353 RepID=UPI00260967DA|nr:hypothetical protein [uncultured Winogradskyella sp.]
MSKLFAIPLSALMLIQSFNIGTDDILQFDELIEHAQFHKQEYGDNFLVFLSKHYGELKTEHSKNHQEEQKDHEQLPFQCQGHFSTVIAFLPHQTPIYSGEIETLDSTEFNFRYFNFYSSLYEEKQLQPPKQA